MPSADSRSLPALGVGIVWVRGLEALLEPRAALVDAIEVEPQTLWIEEPASRERYHLERGAFARLRALRQAKLVHGVGFPVGGTLAPDPLHLPALRASIETLAAPWASEHLAFNRFALGEGTARAAGAAAYTGFLLPPHQSAAGVEAAAGSIRSVAVHLPVPFAVETGVNYLRPRAGELSDGAFIAAVAQAADCGILLDLHNLWCNQRNGRARVADVIRQLPLERVWEIHVAGGMERNGYWLDAHSGTVPREVLDLAAEIVPLLPNLRAIVFEILATFVSSVGVEAIAAQLRRLREIWGTRGTRRGFGRDLAGMAGNARSTARETPAEWERALGSLVIGRDAEGALARELSADPGVELLRELVRDFRAGMVAGTMPRTVRALLEDGRARARMLIEAFWQTRPPQLFGSSEARAFAEFLEELPRVSPRVRELAAEECARIAALTAR